MTVRPVVPSPSAMTTLIELVPLLFVRILRYDARLRRQSPSFE